MVAMGDGFKAAFVLLSYANGGGLTLLDTPELFQHTQGLKLLAASIADSASEQRAQFILATQSLEFLDILLNVSKDRDIGMKVFRFSFIDGHRFVHTPFSLEEALESRELIGSDLRG